MSEWSLRNRLDRREIWLRLAREVEYDPRKLAERVGVSLRQLQRYFSQDFGMPPREWLKEKRAVDARVLLRERISLKRVAVALGYDHASQFSRDFKVSYRMTPKEFRRRCVQPFSVESRLGLKKSAFTPPRELR